MPDSTHRPDVIVIGAGIAGASLAARLAGWARVLILDMEEHPGYHSTSRSAANYEPTFGPPLIRKLTLASGPFLRDPPAGFTEVPLLSARGVLSIGGEGDGDLAEEAIGWGYRRATFAEVAERAPLLRPEGLAHVLVDETTMDVDVEALHRGFLRLHKQAGGELVCRARLETAQRRGGVWHLETTAGSFAAPIVANAAGAWADRVAAAFGLAPLGLQPKRRSAAIVAGPAGVDVRGWLQVGDLRETFYLKPTGGKLMLCPVDADPCEPHDAYADDMRLAEAVEAMQRHVRLEVTRLERTWGGLRTFAPDSNPVIGLDPRAEGFFWSAGQGGYGIQTSAAWSEAAAALLLGDPMPAHVAELGIMARDIAPDRLL